MREWHLRIFKISGHRSSVPYFGMVGDEAVFTDVDGVLEAEQIRHFFLRTFAQTHRAQLTKKRAE